MAIQISNLLFIVYFNNNYNSVLKLEDRSVSLWVFNLLDNGRMVRIHL